MPFSEPVPESPGGRLCQTEVSVLEAPSTLTESLSCGVCAFTSWCVVLSVHIGFAWFAVNLLSPQRVNFPCDPSNPPPPSPPASAPPHHPYHSCTELQARLNDDGVAYHIRRKKRQEQADAGGHFIQYNSAPKKMSPKQIAEMQERLYAAKPEQQALDHGHDITIGMHEGGRN